MPVPTAQNWVPGAHVPASGWARARFPRTQRTFFETHTLNIQGFAKSCCYP